MDTPVLYLPGSASISVHGIGSYADQTPELLFAIPAQQHIAGWCAELGGTEQRDQRIPSAPISRSLICATLQHGAPVRGR
jgi:hypothetical protein